MIGKSLVVTPTQFGAQLFFLFLLFCTQLFHTPGGDLLSPLWTRDRMAYVSVCVCVLCSGYPSPCSSCKMSGVRRKEGTCQPDSCRTQTDNPTFNSDAFYPADLVNSSHVGEWLHSCAVTEAPVAGPGRVEWMQCARGDMLRYVLPTRKSQL